MEIENKHKYFAFISYKREDEEWAKWLQHKLEHYKLPSNLNGRTDLPKEIRPVFKDTSELNPGNLPQQIHDALEQSKHLIVICSPRSAQSEWVNKEVETFMEMGKTERIIPFIIDGKAFAKDPSEECFPLAIRNLPAEQEILGANISEMGRDAAAVKVVAQMFGLRFDELWQRHEREQRRKRNWIIAASIMGFLVMSGIACWMYFQRQETLKANWKTMENLSRFVAEKACSLVDEGDSYLAQRLLLEMLPENVEKPLDKPYTVEIEAALRKASSYHSTILDGHEAEVNFAVFSPDGKKIASASSDKTIRIWDALNGMELIKIERHESPVFSVAFSHDGERIASASWDSTIRIWDSETGKQLNIIKGRSDFWSVAFSPDGKHIASTSGKAIHIWDVNTTKEFNVIDGFYYSIAYSPDGKKIISPSTEEPSIKIWDAETGNELLTIKTSMSINSAAFSPDGKFIIAAARDNAIHIWDAVTGEEQYSLKGHTDHVKYAAFSKDEKYIVSASLDRTIRIWDAQTGAELTSLSGHTDQIQSVAFSPNGQCIVSASWDKTLRIWDSGVCKELNVLEGHTNIVWSAAFNPEGSKIVSASLDSTIRTWDAETGKQLSIMNYDKGPIFFATFTADGKNVVTFSEKDTTYSFQPFAFSHDEKHSVIPRQNTVLILDIDSDKVLNTLEGHSSMVTSSAFSPDDRRIVSSSTDGTVRIWDFPPLQELIDQTRERFKDRPLTPEERRMYYLE